jgi:hypothetical protein
MQFFMSFLYPKLGLIDKLLLSCWVTGTDRLISIKFNNKKIKIIFIYEKVRQVENERKCGDFK